MREKEWTVQNRMKRFTWNDWDILKLAWSNKKLINQENQKTQNKIGVLLVIPQQTKTKIEKRKTFKRISEQRGLRVNSEKLSGTYVQNIMRCQNN